MAASWVRKLAIAGSLIEAPPRAGRRPAGEAPDRWNSWAPPPTPPPLWWRIADPILTFFAVVVALLLIIAALWGG